MSKKETKAKENKEQNTSAETEEKAVDTEVEETKEPTVEDQLADVKNSLLIRLLNMQISERDRQRKRNKLIPMQRAM